MDYKRYFSEYIRISALADPFRNDCNALSINESNTIYVHDAKFILFLKERLNFKFEILLTPDGQYGNALPDGNWTGMIGMIQREEADIAIADLVVSKDRLRVVDFSFPYRYGMATFVTAKPEYLTSHFALLHPFSPLVWATIFASVIAFLFVYYVIKSRKDDSRNVLLKTYANLLGISTKFKMQKLRTKFLILSWIVGTMFITLSYKAVLLSFLISPSEFGMRYISQLAKSCESSTFICSALPGTYLYPALVNSTEDNLKKVGECLTRSNAFTEDLVSFLRSGSNRKAFIAEASHFIGYQNAFYVSKDAFFSSMSAVSIRKTFCCKSALDEVINGASAFGLLHRLEREESFFKGQKSYVEVEQSSPNRYLSLRDFSGAFILLISGSILSFAAFAFEVFLSRLVKQQKRFRFTRKCDKKK